MNRKNITKVSKFLSLILRHKPQTIGLKLDAHGWADIDEIISNSKNIKLNREIIDEVVSKDNKQRFIIEGDKIRANQGHSIEVDLELKAITPPDILYHGTATRFLESIMKTGLSRQNRQYVHLSKDIKTAISVGKRHGKVIVLEVDAKRMIRDGYEFYLSENGVWLTGSVPVGYLREQRD